MQPSLVQIQVNAVTLLQPHKKDGYKIVHNMKTQTVYLMSHKKKVVGAVNYSEDGTLTRAESPLEANDWYESDKLGY